MTGCRRGEDGSAGLLAVWAAVIVLSFSGAAVVVGAAVVARHRAARTADLAALAGARAMTELGPGDGCAAADRLVAATSSAARVTGCTALPDGTLMVVVELPALAASGGGLLGRLAAEMPPARGRARAGVQ